MQKQVFQQLKKLSSTEHIRNTKSHKASSNIANQAWSNDHAVNFEGEIIDRRSYRTRKTLECGHTALDSQAHNHSKPLTAQ